MATHFVGTPNNLRGSVTVQMIALSAIVSALIGLAIATVANHGARNDGLRPAIAISSTNPRRRRDLIVPSNSSKEPLEYAHRAPITDPPETVEITETRSRIPISVSARIAPK